MRRKTIDRIVAAAEVDGGPSQDVLIELGLEDDPNAPDDEDKGEGLIVPGQDPGESGGELIVPGGAEASGEDADEEE